MEKKRFYIDEIHGCIRIIDREKEDGTPHGVEDAVVRYWDAEHRVITCPQCYGSGRLNAEVMTDAIRQKAQAACDALNEDGPEDQYLFYPPEDGRF
jgi:hypothetical protein